MQTARHHEEVRTRRTPLAPQPSRRIPIRHPDPREVDTVERDVHLLCWCALFVHEVVGRVLRDANDRVAHSVTELVHPDVPFLSDAGVVVRVVARHHPAAGPCEDSRQ